MDTITRRQFLKATGAGAIGAAAMSLSIEEIANAAIQGRCLLELQYLLWLLSMVAMMG